MDLLPDNAEEVAKGYEMPEDVKRRILSHLRAQSNENQKKTILQIMNNGGEEARFLRHVLTKDPPKRKNSPKNKRVGPAMTKNK